MLWPKISDPNCQEVEFKKGHTYEIQVVKFDWFGKIKITPNITKIIVNLPQLDLIIITWEKFHPFSLSLFGSIACPKNGWKLNIIHNHSKCVHDMNENMFELVGPPLSQPTWVIIGIILNCRKKNLVFWKSVKST